MARPLPPKSGGGGPPLLMARRLVEDYFFMLPLPINPTFWNFWIVAQKQDLFRFSPEITLKIVVFRKGHLNRELGTFFSLIDVFPKESLQYPRFKNLSRPPTLLRREVNPASVTFLQNSRFRLTSSGKLAEKWVSRRMLVLSMFSVLSWSPVFLSTDTSPRSVVTEHVNKKC